MKKLIAISVMLVLVAGAVFAETTVSGQATTGLVIVSGDDAKVTVGGKEVSTKPKTKGSIGDAQITLSGTNEEGTLGGNLRIKADEVGLETGIGFANLFVWWQPIPQVKIFLGIDQDGKFGTDALEGWAYHQGAEGYMNNHDWGFWRTVFPGNWDGFGLALSVYPVEGLDINIVVPTGKTAWRQNTINGIQREWRIDEMYIKGLRLNANYNIDGVGKIMLTYLGQNAVASSEQDYAFPLNGNADDTWEGNNTKGLFGASFLLTAVENLQVHVGGSIKIANDDEKCNWGAFAKLIDEDCVSPTYIGIGATYSADAFGVKARAAYGMNQEFKLPKEITGLTYDLGGTSKDVSVFNFSVMPYYKLEKLTIFCDVGANMTLYSGDVKDQLDISGYTEFFVNPYITVPLSGGKFQIGLKINNFSKNVELDGTVPGYLKETKSHTTFSVPMAIGFSF